MSVYALSANGKEFWKMMQDLWKNMDYPSPWISLKKLRLLPITIF